MEWPQLVMICIYVIDAMHNLHEHGKPAETSFWNSLIGIPMSASILYAGGFWS